MTSTPVPVGHTTCACDRRSMPRVHVPFLPPPSSPLPSYIYPVLALAARIYRATVSLSTRLPAPRHLRPHQLTTPHCASAIRMPKRINAEDPALSRPRILGSRMPTIFNLQASASVLRRELRPMKRAQADSLASGPTSGPTSRISPPHPISRVFTSSGPRLPTCNRCGLEQTVSLRHQRWVW